MSTLILKMSMALDSYVGGPHGELDWLFKTPDKAVTAWEVETLWNASAHRMGWKTYADVRSGCRRPMSRKPHP